MEQFKRKFIEEAYELIAKLEFNLLSFEQNTENKETVQEIFRVMHTFKGTSAMFGFDNVSEFTHFFENIYAEIRDGKLIVNEKIIELSFEAVDILKLMINEDKSAPEKSDLVLEKIKEILKPKNTIKVETKIENIIDLKNSQPTYYIIFLPNTKIIENNVNFNQLFSQLSQIGQFAIINHTFPKVSDVEDYDLEWGIYLTTKTLIEEIDNIFKNFPVKYKILKVSNYNLFNKQEFIDKLDILKKNTNDSLAIQKSILNDNSDEDLSDTIFLFSDDDGIDDEKNKSQNINKEVNITLENINKNTVKIQNLSKQITSRVSVDSEKLDKLMYLVSELIINKAEFEIIKTNKDFTNFDVTIEKLDKLARQFRDVTLSIRLVPINDMLIRFQRLIRDLSKDLNKEVNFITHGTDIELDKNVIDNLAEPIMHIIRNSLDHGIENPTIRKQKGKTEIGIIEFNSFYSGTNVIIKIKDDGKGIDKQLIVEKAITQGFVSQDAKLSNKEIYDLIFLPGFSTAQNLTEVSGRGVGMDVVRRKIADLRGEIEINSEINLGTEISIKIPISLSILDALLIRIDNLYCLIPLDVVDSCTEEMHDILIKLPNSRIALEDALIPFIYLRKEFNIYDNVPKKERIVLIHSYNRKIGLVVDEVLGEHQAVLKPLGEIFKNIEFVSGGSILGSGDVAMVLDTNKLVEKISLKN